MPYSSSEGKDWLADRYRKMFPLSVVDIGVGSGTYSDLLRPLSSPVTCWIGYEIWAPYIAQFNLRAKYDDLRNADVRLVPLAHADLMIAGDVLEHMTKADAVELIGHMKERAGHIFVSLPIVHYPQGEVGGNPHEAHVHHWTHDEMLEALADSRGDLESFQGEVIGAYHWQRDGVTY